MNDRSRITERDIEYLGGVAFGISEVLLPPGVAGQCDDIQSERVKVSCVFLAMSVSLGVQKYQSLTKSLVATCIMFCSYILVA